jgi:predicted nucleic acid-binding protein
VNATAEPIVLDTDVVSRLLAGTVTSDLAARLTGLTPIVTFVTVGELFRGAAHAGWGARRLGTLTAWLERVPMIPADAPVARRWGEVTGTALRSGRPLPANDAWIAACCLLHDVALATYNPRHFGTIDDLKLVTAGA